MINIAKKKLPFWLISIIVYISYCATNWYSSRGSVAYYSQQFDMPGWFANDAWAFFLGGIVSFVIYEILCSFVLKMMQAKTGGDVASLRYGLSLTVTIANLFLFVVKFIYIAVPLYAPIIDIVIDPIVTIIFVALYMWYAFYQNYFEKSRYRIVLTHVLGTFLVIYGLLSLINLIMAIS